MDTAPLLELHSVTRSYPGVFALDDVSFDVRAGEVHALVGENGAGKSTLINLVSGVLRPDSGEVRFEGQPIRLADPVAARSLGIVTVHQETELFAELSVAENMALMQGLPTKGARVDWPRVYEAADKAVASVEDDIDVRRAAGSLSVAQRQMTHVAAAVTQKAKLVILDEPTSALSEVEAEWLFGQINRLRSAGAGIIYISHRQEEIFALADRITVLRDGRRVWSGDRAEIDRAGLIQQMVGREVSQIRSQRDEVERGQQPARLEVRGLTDARDGFRDIDLSVEAGEIVGVYGLIGAGRSEVAQTIFGLRTRVGGSILVDGKPTEIRSPRDAIAAGIAYVPEDRLRQALCRDLSIISNTVLASLKRWRTGPLLSHRRERQATDQTTSRLAVKLRSPTQPIGQLSGGNQQKVVLGRWLLNEPSVLILDEPTRGVDVGAKDEIHRLLRELADGGSGILMISSELPEVMQHADRVVVLRHGRVAGEFDANTTPQEIAAAALPHDEHSDDEPVTSGAERTSGWFAKLTRLVHGELALLVAVLVLASWLALTSDGFSVSDLAAKAAFWSILGLAAAVVIIGGGIDISIGALLALSAATAAQVLRLDLPAAITIPLATLVGCAVGCAGGALNAAIALAGRVHPIVVTLGTMTIYRGLVIALLGDQAITGLPPSFTRMAVDPATGFRGSIVVSAVVIAAIYWWLNHLPSGRHAFALGASETAARLAGISRWRTWLLTFGVGGTLVGLAGVVELAQTGQMQAPLGGGWELNAIAIAVIGGVAISGGRGSVLGVALGAILLRLINSTLVRWGISADQVEFVVGALILTAVLLDLTWRRFGESRERNMA